MNDGQQTCAITGANGYVGSRVAAHFRNQGWRVLEMRRQSAGRETDDPDRIPFDLAKEIRWQGLEGVDLLVHCAWDFRPSWWDDIVRVNVDGSVRLLEGAKAAAIPRIVFLSTMSAFDGCKSYYGRAKLAVEEAGADLGVVSVRPGLVFGDQPGGTVGALSRVVSLSPIIPLVDGGGYELYLAHEEDLCRMVFELGAGDERSESGPVLGADETPWSLRRILSVLAVHQGRKVRFVNVPGRWLLAVMRAAEAVHLRLGFRSDSLVSLLNQEPDPDFAITRKLGVAFRRFDVST